MKKHIVFFLAAVMVLPAFAEKRGSVMRGGFGFLFPDMNHFTNGGQMALNRGTAINAEYSKADLAGTESVAPSVVWSNGKVGMGAGVDRTGVDMSSSAATMDTLSAQAGAAVGDKVTVGAVYSRMLESSPVNDGTLSGQINMHFGKPGQGFVVGVEAGTTLGGTATTQSGTAALGYAFASGLMLEGAYQVGNWSDATNNHIYSASMVYNHSSWYVAGQYNAVTLAGTEPNIAAGRLGVVWGSVDLSAQVVKGVYTGGDTTYGGTLRLVF